MSSRKVTSRPTTLSRSIRPSSLASSASMWNRRLICSLMETELTASTSGPNGVLMPSNRESCLIGMAVKFSDFKRDGQKTQREFQQAVFIKTKSRLAHDLDFWRRKIARHLAPVAKNLERRLG